MNGEMCVIRKVGFVEGAGEVMKARALKQAKPRPPANLRFSEYESFVLQHINSNKGIDQPFTAAFVQIL